VEELEQEPGDTSTGLADTRVVLDEEMSLHAERLGIAERLLDPGQEGGGPVAKQ